MRRTRVLIDASIMKPQLGGIRTYARGLVQALCDDPRLEIVVVTGQPDVFAACDCPVLPTRFDTRSFLARAAWREWQLPRLVQRVQAEVVFVLFPELPVRRLRVPACVMLYDLTPIRSAPSTLRGRARASRYRLGTRHIVRNATAIASVSHHTLETLRSLYTLDEDTCRVIHPGSPSLGTGHRGSGARRRYVLYVGEVRAHKNVDVLVDALVALPDVSLTIAGPALGSDVEALNERARRAGVADRFEHRGFVPADELARLYEEASVFAFPSLHEGFGLPVIEAMSLGAPVLLSDIPVLREVAGDAADYVTRPTSPDAWAAAIRRLVDDDALRNARGEDGRRRAETFDWAKSAERCGDLLVSIA